MITQPNLLFIFDRAFDQHFLNHFLRKIYCEMYSYLIYVYTYIFYIIPNIIFWYDIYIHMYPNRLELLYKTDTKLFYFVSNLI